MPIHRTPPGELGAVQVTRLAGGQFWARGRMRDDAGKLHQLRAVGATEEEARAELRRRAMRVSTGGSSRLGPESTLAEAGEAWLLHIKTRAATGSLSYVVTAEQVDPASAEILDEVQSAPT
jgi:hypothetical protein